MDYTSNFITIVRETINTSTMPASIGMTEGITVVVFEFQKEWSLEDMADILWKIKKTNLKIKIYVHIYNGSQFPKLSQINRFDWPSEVYDDATSILVGLKNTELFTAEAAKQVNDIKNNKLIYTKNLEEAQKVFDSLIKEEIISQKL